MKKKNYELNKNFKHDVKVQEIREKAIGELLSKKTIEIKTEMGMWKDTGNIAIELKFNGKPSGLAKTEADYWWHSLELDDKPFAHIVFDTETLRTHLKSLHKQGKVKKVVGGDDNLSEIALVKITDLINPQNIDYTKEQWLGL